MTKAEELAVLDAAIAKLGPDSYIGPWLREQRFEIEQNITSDLPPAMSWRDHYAHQDRCQKTTEKYAAQIIEEAKASAQRLRESEARKIKGALAQAIQTLERASKVLADDWSVIP